MKNNTFVAVLFRGLERFFHSLYIWKQKVSPVLHLIVIAEVYGCAASSVFHMLMSECRIGIHYGDKALSSWWIFLRRDFMLQIKNVSITHKKDSRCLIQNLHFVLNAGDKAVLIGEEGNGKSTILKWIFNPLLVEGYAEAEGERFFAGECLGYLPQELEKEDAERTVCEYFMEDAAFWEQTPRELGELAKKLQLSMDFYYRSQKMKTLSGGERIKVQMARILIANPSVLLLDEPSNDIDISTLEWLEQLILDWDEMVLFISHDETLIENTANKIIHIEQIRRKTLSRFTVADMTYQDYISGRKARINNQMRQAGNDKRMEQTRQEKYRRIQQKVEQNLRSISRQDPSGGRLLKKKMKAVKSLEKRYEREAENMAKMPEEEEALFVKFGEAIRIPSAKMILDFKLSCLASPDLEGEGRILARDIVLKIRGPEKICIIGKNGAGKSTLLKKIAAELLERKDMKAAYMPQNYEELLDGTLNPVEYLQTTGEKEELTRIRTYLGAMKYTADEMQRPLSELSGGQKAKVLLLKMSLSGAEVLILDEPTRNFSPLSNPVIREVLAAYKGAVISVSHDRKFIREVCSVVYILSEKGLERAE